MTESYKCELRKRPFNMRSLRISLKYRPEIMKLILKMKQCIKRKNSLLKQLKHKLKIMNQSNNLIKHSESTDNTNYESNSNLEKDKNSNKKQAKNSSTQTSSHSKIPNTDNPEEANSKVLNTKNYDQSNTKEAGWIVNKDDGEEKKSIAEQVKEVAQSAMQQSGMVYVESAGMYYDYKTGYYYNSELGLYYHTDTGCYYYYSEEAKTFVFHSYPDQSAVAANAKLAAHEKRKAKKHKTEKTKEDAIDNLTKNLSQDKEDGSDQATKRKRRKIVKKQKIKVENKPSEVENKDQDSIKAEAEWEKNKDLSPSEKQESNEKRRVKKMGSKEEELEDGECSDSGSEAFEISDEEDASVISTSTASDDDSIARQHPPCMRIIVRETNLPKLKVGSLFLITKDGGTVGREGDYHTIILRDNNVSRDHLDVKYDTDRSTYVVTDLGSKNGSILNGNRMSESQVVSKPMEVMHGSVIQLGETKLLCHVHPGNDTCGHCEPGLIMETQEKETKAAYTRTCSIQKQHQLELARLKNKYAPKPLAIEETAYNDRAQARRETVGSSHHSEKTKSNDLDTYIEPENKGFKLLEKMGWSKGEGLGKDNQGDTEPVPIISNEGKAGLGTSGATGAPAPRPIVVKNNLGAATLRLASKTKMLQPPAKAFQESFNEDSD